MPRAPSEQAKQKKAEAEKLFNEGMALVEIAKKLGVSEGTVRSWKNRGGWGESIKKNKCNVAKNVAKEKTTLQKKTEPVNKTAMPETDIVCENEDLTDKQSLFCIYYIRSFNATKAYQKAYQCSYKTATVNGPRLLKNTRIKETIRQLKQGRLNRELLSEEDIFQKYMDIAFADITDFVEFGTEEVPVMAVYGPVQIKDEKTGKKKILTQTVNTVYFRGSDNVDGSIISEIKQGKDGVSIKLADRMKALQWLSDHMDLATEEQRVRIATLKSKTETRDDNVVDDWISAVMGEDAVSDG
jgi:phage terminase small subunit